VVLEEIAHALRPVGEQLDGECRLEVRRAIRCGLPEAMTETSLARRAVG
jgi:hypothetical protein